MAQRTGVAGDGAAEAGGVPGGPGVSPPAGASDIGDDESRPDARRRRTRLAVPLLDAALLSAVTMGLLAVVMRLWKADLHVPFAYFGDADFHAMLVKSSLRHGWYLHNPDLGAPFGQKLFDFPLGGLGGDNLHFAAMKALGTVLHDPVAALDVYYLACFVLVSLAAFFVMRHLGVSRPAAGAAAVLYTFLPYHFAHNSSHVLLSAYWGVPLAVLLLVWQLDGRLSIGRRRAGAGARAEGLTHGRALAVVVLAALIGASSGYYATFTLVLLGLAALVQAAHDRRLAPLVSAVLPAAVIAVVLVANLVPALVYAHDHGGGAIGHRQPYEAETYGLKLTQLVMPVEGHRLEPLARLKDRSLKGPVHDELGMSLGAVGAIGFVVLVGLALGALAGVRPPASALRRRLSMLTVLAVLVATVSGVSYLLALFGLTTIRVWERIVVFISLFSLCAMATLADDLRARWRGRRWGAPAVAAALAVVTVIGVLDQTTNADIPDYPARRREFASDAAFVHALERRLPPRAMVFQLPYMPFPDSPNVGDVFSFDLFRLYLHSTTLRWSYGGAEGREAEWQPRWLAQPQERQLEGLTAVGFQGLTLDRRAWGDHGAATEAGIAATLGEAPYASPDGTMSFFDLRPLAERTRAALGAGGVAALRRETLSGARPG